MIKFTKWFSVFIIANGISYLGFLISLAKPLQTPEEALQSFYTHDVAEDMLMDPLVLAGKKVVPLVIKAVKNTEMPRRRYAIAFLGNDTYTTALPVLEEILKDKTEKDYFRGDALLSIYKIDKKIGQKLATKYKGSNNYLGKMCKEVFEDSSYANETRSYFDALRGWHE